MNRVLLVAAAILFGLATVLALADDGWRSALLPGGLLCWVVASLAR